MFIDSEYLAFEEEFPKHFSGYYAYNYYHFSVLAYKKGHAVAGFSIVTVLWFKDINQSIIQYLSI